MIEKIGFSLFLGFLIILAGWVMFCVAPIMMETAMDALKLWRELL